MYCLEICAKRRFKSAALWVVFWVIFVSVSCVGDSGNDHTDSPDADSTVDTDFETDASDTNQMEQVDSGGDVMEADTGDENGSGLPSITCEDSGSAGEYVSSEEYETIAAGSTFSCGIVSDGSVECWGEDGFGVVSMTPSGEFEEIYAGSNDACAVGADGEATCWGRLTDPPNSSGSSWYTMALGFNHACGLYEDGSVACWGDEMPASDPPDSVFTDLAATGDATCGIVAGTGAIECWGENADGQTEAPDGEFATISGAGRVFCALSAEGRPSCWGLLGEDEPPSSERFAVLKAAAMGCVLDADGHPTCWPDEHDAEAFVPSGDEDRCFTEWALGTGHACGVRADGRVECFGRSNAEGRLDVP